jgi:hypothetical protein
MQEALSHCREHHPGLPIALAAPTHLLPFYRSFGFEPTGEPFDPAEAVRMLELMLAYFGEGEGGAASARSTMQGAGGACSRRSPR